MIMFAVFYMQEVCERSWHALSVFNLWIADESVPARERFDQDEFTRASGEVWLVY